MRAKNNNTVMTTFGTQLTPVNLTEGLFVLTSDAEASMDTPLADYVGTKKIFKKGSIVSGTFWKETTEDGKSRKVVMVTEKLSGRYLINKNSLEPTTQAAIDAKSSKSEIENLTNKVKNLLENAKDEAKELIEDSEENLDKKYFGFTGKQILVATLGVIVLIKVFK
jgi:hypothetical protein